jgi:hypothetical protein
MGETSIACLWETELVRGQFLVDKIYQNADPHNPEAASIMILNLLVQQITFNTANKVEVLFGLK